ncbi:uncharacterized protein F4812DRAFT_149741 [Daldinia caldariorum]|uniref:uncharacterized protein n=1 Tax=Daldinia caldariorum TaxID=326644 RepID=UPI002008C753|nr:uncharacterized protein F4812DRAFT_149741 [Daldinia caldariorum]KAI1464663.1 hypothetical protein F4812DRAFT_149741 [Daldinia caldariorum]
MSADLFAAFEDASDRSSKGQQQKTSVQASSFASDPFSFGLGNVTNSSYNTRQNASSISQQWSNGSTQWGRQLQNTQRPSGPNTWLNAPLQSSQSNTKIEEDDDEDGWGDFEVAENSNQPPAPSVASTSLSGATTKEPQNPALLRTRVVRASTMDLITNNLLDLSNLSISQGKTAQSSSAQAAAKRVELPTPKTVSLGTQKKVTNPNPNVLFDADDFGGEQHEGENDEDFGEFETVVSPAQEVPDLLSMDSSTTPKTNTKPRAANMLSPLNLTNPVSYPQAPRSPSFQERNPFPGLAVATPTIDKHFTNDPKTSPVTAWPSLNAQKSAGSEGFGDDWGAFDDFPDEEAKSNTKTNSDWDWDSIESAQLKPPTTHAPPPTAPKPQNSSWDWDPIDIKTEQQTTEPNNDLPPTNVPPPSVLLSLFPELLAQANTSLYKPISGQPFSIKNRILSDPKTIEFLKGYLALATVLARVIAGRKLRWHRDKLLSQKMSISAAGSKGMKLAGVDKAQAAREDREAADVVANWKEQIGRLRSAVAAANSSIKNKTEQLKIPEISESMHIQNEKMVPTAPKACVVCGLKRNERIPKVDYEVEDSFGEWWVDHWGHLACKRFWLQHENTLRQR